jgi:cyclopropane fatty-acyl-phospholipid synthase-like methyltransferase
MDEIGALYAKHAQRFDEARSRKLIEQSYLDAALSAMPAASRILDLGCGAGEPIARYFVEKGHQVTGVDLAGPMIELCRRRMPEMTFIHADMRSVELDQRFDLIVAWDSFFHLDKVGQRAMFTVFARHAAPHGMLLFTSGWSEGVAIGDLFGDELYHSSLDTTEYEQRLREQDYRVLQHRVQDPDCDRTVWLAQRQM